MEIEDRYSYPNSEAEFGPYNFHRPAIVEGIAELLVSDDARSPRVIELAGAPQSGRHYLLRAAAYQAGRRGEPVAVMSLDLTGYEPDQPLKEFVAYLAKREDLPDSHPLTEIAKRAKVEAKVTAWSFLGASLAVKWDPTVEELRRLLETSGPPGPGMSPREILRRLLERATRNQRLVLHVRDGQVLDVALRARLMDEVALNPRLYVAVSYAGGGIRRPMPGVHRVHVPAWSREELGRAVRRDYSPVHIPANFLDFLWDLSPDRESLARLLLRITTKAGPWIVASVDAKGRWVVGDGWQKNRALLEELSRDLFDPIDELLADFPEEMQSKARRFLFGAALCDPTIPVNQLMAAVGVSKAESSDLLDAIDDAYGPDGGLAVFADLGFSNPGFPASELLYRFRNPVLPGVILKRCPDPDQLAMRILTQLTGALRPDSRAIAKLYLQLAESAGSISETEQYTNQLCWWTSVDEAELLKAGVSESLREGDVSPAVTWSVIKKSDDVWLPARRMALLEAYGEQPDGIALSALFDFLITKAHLLVELGRYAEARQAAEQSLEVPIPEPEWFFRCRANHLLGFAEYLSADLLAASGHFEANLAIYQKHLPPDHPNILITWSHLGNVYRMLGRFQDAEPLLFKAWESFVRISGPEAPSTLSAANSLAGFYKSQGRYTDAEPLFARVLEVRQRELGDEHPITLTVMDNLADLYDHQGRFDEAEVLFSTALAVWERNFGEDHPDTLTCMNNLAGVYVGQSRYDEAEPLLVRAMDRRERLLGPEHPDVLAATDNLAGVYMHQGRYDEAEPLYLKASQAWERILGPDHPDTLISMSNLGALYERQGRYDEAEKIYLRVLAARQRTQGPGHPDTQTAAFQLAMLHARRADKVTNQDEEAG